MHVYKINCCCENYYAEKCPEAERAQMRLSCFESQNETTGLFSIGSLWSIDPIGQNISVIAETLSLLEAIVHVISPNATIPERVILGKHLNIGARRGATESGVKYLYEVRMDYSGYLFLSGLQPSVLDDPGYTISVSSNL